MKPLLASVIISTYNKPEWLEKVLWSYMCQSNQNFEIVIADDGSDNDTRGLIDRFKAQSAIPITHTWQEDDGFQKTRILNKAILATNSDYLIFTDGDCVARQDFVATHLNLREEGYMLSGGYFKLPMSISKLITKQVIESQRCFDIDWLKEQGLKRSFKNNKISAGALWSRFLNSFTTTKATWNGNNSSGWKADIMKVKGFDERMQYGGEDREMGERLFNMGIKAKQIRYSAICLHLYHDRPYVRPEMLTKNREIRDVTRRERRIETPYGL